MNRAVLAGTVAVGIGILACAPVSAADPGDPAADTQPVSAETDAAATEIADACKLFNAALNVAAANYEDFAYATAGNGDYVDYGDPNVSRTNVVGRTALRQAAAAALSASRTPGLPPEAADPMRSWSLHATKLVLVMGLHGGGDSLNNSVAALNTEGGEAQMACALAAGRG